MVRRRRMELTRWPYRHSILAGLFYTNHCRPESIASPRQIQHPGNSSLYTKGLEDFGPQRHSLIDKLRKGNLKLAMILSEALNCVQSELRLQISLRT